MKKGFKGMMARLDPATHEEIKTFAAWQKRSAAEVIHDAWAEYKQAHDIRQEFHFEARRKKQAAHGG